MITVQNLALRFGSRTLFEDVNLKFTNGNCYGIIGANGAGKSSFIKLLSGELEASQGDISLPEGKRLAVLKQDHFAYNDYPVLKTVIMGFRRLFEVMEEKDAIYEKADFTDEDGIRVSELEEEFEDLGGWEAEAQAGSLLDGLGIDTSLHDKLMKDLEDNQKVRVLLSQALFGDPDILLLDEPTNHLDVQSVVWLEEFLYNFKNTVLVVSHDRHFLNRVCTHMVDIDYGKITMHVGNYDFWYQASQLAQKQLKDENKKKEEKAKELKEFIARFSSNASKARQATARKKMLDKLTIDDIKPSTRRYPYINFKPDREPGNDILAVEGLTLKQEGETLLNDISIRLRPEDKVAFVGPNSLATTRLFEVLAGNLEPDSGEIKWGITIQHAYFPKEHEEFFNDEMNLIDWLRQYSKEKEEGFIRGYLGRMLFSGDETLKKSSVLSGGEKVRCMFSRMMLSGANVLIMDEPTNHLDMESITALNNGLEEFKGVLLFTSHDHQLVQTVANRIIEIKKDGTIEDRLCSFDEYLDWKKNQAKQTA